MKNVLITGCSDHLHVVRLDVTDSTSIDAAIRDALLQFGGLDVVVNNAGIGLLAAFEATPESLIRELFETNVFGVMAVTRAVIPHFRERRAGTVINVTSSVGILPMPLVSAYTASKFAIEGFTESLAYELSAFGVRAKIVQPGYGPTTGFTARSPRMEARLPEPYAAYADQLMQGLASARTRTPRIWPPCGACSPARSTSARPARRWAPGRDHGRRPARASTP